ncbi:MAG: DUF192 domain-containing protein [Alphaproteobacteria bacterium]|nr:DUF192 domain-containing protein [Alphaproteobacteria bacterium]
MAFIAAAPLANQEAPAAVEFPTSALSVMVAISDQMVVQHRFTVEVATTTEQRMRGLMFRKELAADSGMLFLFDAPEIIRMWMKNTLIPLDMLFIAPDGTVVDIATDAVPHSEEIIASRAPASAVLELNAGAVMRAGIHIGDRVEHEAFKK